MEKHWHSNKKAVAKQWHIYDTVIKKKWDSNGKALAQQWHGIGTALIKQ